MDYIGQDHFSSSDRDLSAFKDDTISMKGALLEKGRILDVDKKLQFIIKSRGGFKELAGEENVANKIMRLMSPVNIKSKMFHGSKMKRITERVNVFIEQAIKYIENDKLNAFDVKDIEMIAEALHSKDWGGDKDELNHDNLDALKNVIKDFSKEPPKKADKIVVPKPERPATKEDTKDVPVDPTLKEMKSRMVKAAAEKGRARRAAVDFVHHRISKQKPVEKKERIDSVQEVIIDSDAKAVVKGSKIRAASEERLIDDLFQIVMPEGIVPQTKMLPLRTKNLGFAPVEYSEVEHGISIEEMSREETPKIQDKILSFLPENGANSLYKVATYVDQIKAAPPEQPKDYTDSLGYFVPDFENPPTIGDETPEDKEVYAITYKASYEECCRKQWQYRDKQGIWQKIGFHDLQKRYMRGTIKDKTIIRELGDIEAPLRKHEDLKNALACRWLFIPFFVSSELFSDGQKDVVAKPLVESMQLMKNLMGTQKLREHIFENLDDDAYMRAIMTLDFQFMDLHSGNIGFAPVPNEAFRKYENATFLFMGRKRPFRWMQEVYLIGGYIGPKTKIKMYAKDGSEETITLKDKPEIIEAIKCKWTLALFDTDISMGESNVAMSSPGGYMTPLRSHLLATTLKDRKLDDATLHKLREADSHIEEAQRYLCREDSPMRKKFSEKGRRELDEIFRQYNFENQFIKGDNGGKADINALKEVLIKDMLRNPAHKLWTLLNSELKIKPSESKLKKILSQLFPRATIPQQEAYRERVEGRMVYLQDYEEMKRLDVTSMDEDKLKTRLKEYCHDNYMLFSTEYRRIIDEWFDNFPPEEIYDALMMITEPTYFNIAKAMYPLLADDYNFRAELCKHEPSMGDPGSMIGIPTRSFKFAIDDLSISAKTLSQEMQQALGDLKQKLENYGVPWK